MCYSGDVVLCVFCWWVVCVIVIILCVIEGCCEVCVIVMDGSIMVEDIGRCLWEC